MHRRTTSPLHQNYHRYKKNNITVCKEWKDFETFKKDMGPKPTPTHTLDRIDNNKGYHKDNCRWATPKQQRANQGYTNNKNKDNTDAQSDKPYNNGINFILKV
jgi:hypothetical protein